MHDLKDIIVNWNNAKPLEPVVDWSKVKPLEPVVDWSKVEPLEPVKEDDDKLIPVTRVIDDMYGDNSLISNSAKEYYIEHYATSEEKEEIKKEDRLYKILGIFTITQAILYMVLAIVVSLK